MQRPFLITSNVCTQLLLNNFFEILSHISKAQRFEITKGTLCDFSPFLFAS